MQYGEKTQDKWVYLVGLIISIAALIFALLAYNQSSPDKINDRIESQVNRVAEEAKSQINKINMQKSLTDNAARLSALRKDIEDEENYDETIQAITLIKINIADLAGSASDDTKAKLSQIEKNLTQLETEIDTGEGDAPATLDKTVQMMQALASAE